MWWSVNMNRNLAVHGSSPLNLSAVFQQFSEYELSFKLWVQGQAWACSHANNLKDRHAQTDVWVRPQLTLSSLSPCTHSGVMASTSRMPRWKLQKRRKPRKGDNRLGASITSSNKDILISLPLSNSSIDSASTCVLNYLLQSSPNGLSIYEFDSSERNERFK